MMRRALSSAAGRVQAAHRSGNLYGGLSAGAALAAAGLYYADVREQQQR